MKNDPYVLTNDSIQPPPVKLKDKLKYLGPGFILSASVVGSGELISTTTLGAKAGFITFWVIILSCLVKVVLQLEFGKHTIRTGETVMMSLNKLPGPRFGRQKANWSLWMWLFLWLFKPLQLGGIIGGVAITLNMLFPSVNIPVFAVIMAIVVAALVFRGYYRFIEKTSVFMMMLFTLFTILALFFVQFTPFAFTSSEIMEGLKFQLPPESVGFAIAAFGLTGVGGDEIVAYNYWCLEKGYARYTGPYEDSLEWRNRAKGWIKVMYLDAILSMVVYTIVTAAFYLLGAAVLFKRQEIPGGFEMIETLSRLYTDSYGEWAKTVFLVGAAVVLFSTLFAALAARTRIFSDLFGQLEWIDFFNRKQRKNTIAWLAWVFPALWLIALLFVRLPVIMVTIGGIVTFLMLLIIVFAGIHYRYKRAQCGLKPGLIYDITLLVSCIVIFSVGVYGVLKLF
jgi:Mn2+/Fe2+ NRAMP family transporter